MSFKGVQGLDSTLRMHAAPGKMSFSSFIYMYIKGCEKECYVLFRALCFFCKTTSCKGFRKWNWKDLLSPFKLSVRMCENLMLLFHAVQGIFTQIEEEPSIPETSVNWADLGMSDSG